MPTRRQLRAGVGTTGTGIPENLARFRPEDWPPTKSEPDVLEVDESSPYAQRWHRFFARQRWQRAQRRWCAEHDVTAREFWHLIYPGTQ